MKHLWELKKSFATLFLCMLSLDMVYPESLWAASDLIPNPDIIKEYEYTEMPEDSQDKAFRWPRFRRRRRRSTPPPATTAPARPTTPRPPSRPPVSPVPTPSDPPTIPPVTPPVTLPTNPLPPSRPTRPTDPVGPGLPSSYKELIPYVMASPNQEEAGSCLYMSLTGIAEFFLARKYPHVSRKENGPIDLSERFLMHLPQMKNLNARVLNWKTDSIFYFNRIGHGVLNTSYPFTKGHYFSSTGGGIRKALPEEEGSKYGAKYNWIPTLEEVGSEKVVLPQFKRRILFADPSSNQWNTGVAPRDIVETIKKALLEKQAPVLVIYNHFGYWHANYIVGYNDRVSHKCRFVNDSLEYMRNQSEKYVDMAEKSFHSSSTFLKSQQYWNKANELKALSGKGEEAYLENGGCSGKGVFYVRDSIYPDRNGTLYDYDKSRRGEENFYSKKIILREYEWPITLANHVVQIYVEE